MTSLIIKERIDFIRQALKVLEDILKKRKSNTSLKDYLFFAAQKKTEEIVESAVKINQELSKKHLNKISNNYYESFVNLDEFKIFSREELKILANSGKFLTKLEHDYLDLNPEITLKSIQKVLKHYPIYLRKINNFLNKK